MNENTATVAAFDADTADVDALRAQIQSLNIDLRQAKRDRDAATDEVTIAVALITDLKDLFDNEASVRSLCADNEDYADLVRSHDIIDLSRDYEIRVTVPVTMTIIVSGDSEDDALENIGEHLSNEVSVDVHGAEEYDFDSYDYSIDGISEA